MQLYIYTLRDIAITSNPITASWYIINVERTVRNGDSIYSADGKQTTRDKDGNDVCFCFV
jgi:hypothetical protein